MTRASSTKGAPAVWRIEGHRHLFGVESQSITLAYWQVSEDAEGNLTCKGNSEHQRCWPFGSKGYCKHTTAVEAFLNAENPGEPEPPMPTGDFHFGTPREVPVDSPLCDLFDYSKPLVRAARRERVKEGF